MRAMDRISIFAKLGCRLVCVLGFAILSAPFGGATVFSAQDGGEMIEWLDDYDEALVEAKRTGKPIFLEFRCSP